MTQARTVHRDAATGAFVSADFAEEHPATTVAQTIAAPAVDQMDADMAAIVALTDSQPVFTLRAVPGIEETGTDPRELVGRVRRAVEAAVAGIST